MTNALIIIPTYNEVDNIEQIVREIFSVAPHVHILIIDDHSPDGTALKIRGLMQEFSQVTLMEREKKLGLATAYLAGFEHAFKKGYEYIFEMDADRSHDPRAIPAFLEAIKDYDLVVGSRYITGGKIENWPLRRYFLSWSANQYARFVTGLPVRDATGGFKCFRRHVLASINLQTVTSRGYSFQIELNHRAWKKGFKICEIPITFADRTRGVSKMSRDIIWEALWIVWKLRFTHT